MGVVHVAQAPDGTRVALKVLRPHVVGDPEGRERLAREVASLRKVRSKHVAEILDADPHGDAPFIVTRYVPGFSLHDTVRQDGPLAPGDLAYAARHLLQAVRDVHAADVLHRDIKPTNVVMEGRAPVLIDFGLARLAEDPRLTATGWLLGSPGYLAPEVLFGDDATTATDVHGWAATVVHAGDRTLALRRRPHDDDPRPDPPRRDRPARRARPAAPAARAVPRDRGARPADHRGGRAELDALDADALRTTALPVTPRGAAPGRADPALAARRPGVPDHEATTRHVPADPPPSTSVLPTSIAPVPPTRVAAPPPLAHRSRCPVRARRGARSSTLVPPGTPGSPSHLAPPSRIAQPPRPVTHPEPPVASTPRPSSGRSSSRPRRCARCRSSRRSCRFGQPPLSRAARCVARRSLLSAAAARGPVVPHRAVPHHRGRLPAGARHPRRLPRRGRPAPPPDDARSPSGTTPRASCSATPGTCCVVRPAPCVLVLVRRRRRRRRRSATSSSSGVRTPDALLVGRRRAGCWCSGTGPASLRVRAPLGRAATSAAPSPVATFVVLGLVVVAVVAVVSAYAGRRGRPGARHRTAVA